MLIIVVEIMVSFTFGFRIRNARAQFYSRDMQPVLNLD